MLDAVIVGFAGVAIFGVVAFAWREVAPVAPFLYANARIQARSKHLIKDDEWSLMAESRSLAELTNRLNDTDYFPYLEEAKTIREYHLGIEKHFVHHVEDLREMSPEKIKPLFDSYLRFWEAKMLKAVYRAKHSGDGIDERLVFPVGNLTKQRLSKLLEAESVADLKVIMTGTFFSPVFEKEYTTLEEFEASIDTHVFEQFVKRVKELKVYDGDAVVNLLNLKFDIQNLLVLLKLEARDIPEEDRQKYLIPNETPLFNRVSDLINSDGIADFVSKCKGLEYYDALENALSNYEKDKSISHFEKALYKFYKEGVLLLERYHFQGPLPMFTHLAKKEIEMRNLMIVSKGVDSKMPPFKIKELII